MAGQKYDPTTNTLSDISDGPEESETEITTIDERLPYHDYQIQELWQREPQKLSARGLLDIVAYVEANRARLEQEAQEDSERNERAMSADMRDMASIKQEWHNYRHTDANGMGDETGPLAEYEHRQRGQAYQNEKDLKEARRDTLAGGPEEE